MLPRKKKMGLWRLGAARHGGETESHPEANGRRLGTGLHHGTPKGEGGQGGRAGCLSVRPSLRLSVLPLTLPGRGEAVGWLPGTCNPSRPLPRLQNNKKKKIREPGRKERRKINVLQQKIKGGSKNLLVGAKKTGGKRTRAPFFPSF